ncbi:unnamed protein product [Paramecium sonneborni]|uniref:Uncharacterized protein n=1 Tax=Paramecium sonneborni TaxID=65129 RepID=A0A8S1RFE7_9CILI|nr:unnamed protein product [Paramecium sonneborni]
MENIIQEQQFQKPQETENRKKQNLARNQINHLGFLKQYERYDQIKDNEDKIDLEFRRFEMRIFFNSNSNYKNEIFEKYYQSRQIWKNKQIIYLITNFQQQYLIKKLDQEISIFQSIKKYFEQVQQLILMSLTFKLWMKTIILLKKVKKEQNIKDCLFLFQILYEQLIFLKLQQIVISMTFISTTFSQIQKYSSKFSAKISQNFQYLS